MICSKAVSLEASTTWHKRSAYITSSKVDLNASTKSCGNFLTKPTVSVRVIIPLFFSIIALVVISRVANNISASNTFSFPCTSFWAATSHRAFLKVDFPALVYPTNETFGMLSLFLFSL